MLIHRWIYGLPMFRRWNHNLVGSFENADGWKYSWVVHDGVMHLWGPFTPKWDKFK